VRNCERPISIRKEMIKSGQKIQEVTGEGKGNKM
jgi:hypothetical protein